MSHGNDTETEALLAREGAAGPLVWWPLLSVLYLLAVPRWESAGLIVLGCGLIIVAMVRAALRLGLSGARPRR